MFLGMNGNQTPTVLPHRIKKKWKDTRSWLSATITNATPAASSSNSIPETQLFWGNRFSACVLISFLLYHSFSTLKMRYKYYTMCVCFIMYACVCLCVCVCELYVCECVMRVCASRSSRAAIGRDWIYKIVAGDCIKQSHTYIFYYVHGRVHIHFVVVAATTTTISDAVAAVAPQLLVFVAVFETQSFNGTKCIL